MTVGIVSGLAKINSRTIVTMAAGRAIIKLALNLSFISTPWVLVAAIVVSDMIDRLSPNIPPLIVAPITMASLIPAAWAKPIAIGATATTVPTDVPVDMAIKQEIIKIPTVIYWGGNTDIPRFTTESTPPICLDTVEKAPASKNS